MRPLACNFDEKTHEDNHDEVLGLGFVGRKIFMIAWCLGAATVPVLVQGCTSPHQQQRIFRSSDFMGSSLEKMPYDSPPQVIYRIDDHRFVTLERYHDCRHGESYYNDAAAGIRKFLGRGLFENFQGRIINADPVGMNIVLPLAYPSKSICGDGEKGCVTLFWYSSDGGRKFRTKAYMNHGFDPFKESLDYTFLVTRDGLYISQRMSGTSDYSFTVRYPMSRDFASEQETLPLGRNVEYDVEFPPHFGGQVDQDRITCDSSIKPTNPDAPLFPVGHTN